MLNDLNEEERLQKQSVDRNLESYQVANSRISLDLRENRSRQNYLEEERLKENERLRDILYGSSSVQQDNNEAIRRIKEQEEERARQYENLRKQEEQILRSQQSQIEELRERERKLIEQQQREWQRLRDYEISQLRSIQGSQQQKLQESIAKVNRKVPQYSGANITEGVLYQGGVAIDLPSIFNVPPQEIIFQGYSTDEERVERVEFSSDLDVPNK